jgi:hypothetical protein
MSNQSGSDGYNKVKKSCQRGGASGWAKHCGDKKDHQLSNRAERRLAKDEIVSGDEPRPPRAKRTKIPTRRHLMDKLAHIDKQISSRKKDVDAHKKKKPDCEGCYMYCSKDRWLDDWHARDRAKIMKEFEKHGYRLP